MTFDKDRRFITRSVEPFNGGSPPQILRQSFITPIEHFFVRSHAPVPMIDVQKYRLSVGGHVRAPLEYSLDELMRKFPPRESTTTLACAGNRRHELIDIQPIPGEVPWGNEAISNARWEGARLSDVLAAAGVDTQRARHVEFIGMDEVSKAGDRFGFGGSIPLDKAMSCEVLLAWGMNGAPLPAAHGFPLRVIVPGYIGARSVKWLRAVNLIKQPSENYYQARAYKLFAPEVDENTADWTTAEPLGELGVNSMITSPAERATVRAGEVRIEGIAIGGRGALQRVEVSADDGITWTHARLLPEGERWSWRLWEAELKLAPGRRTIIARAFDSAGESQPPDARALWNFKGYMNNAWHRVRVIAQ